MNGKVKDLLEKRKEKIFDNKYVFSKIIGVKFNNDFVSKNFKKAVRKAKISEKVHFHTLRHSFASRLVQKGASIYIVKELLGHRDVTTTQIYSHLEQSNLKKVIRLL